MKTSDILSEIVRLCAHEPRILVGIAGPPGAGKSTISEGLYQDLERSGISAKIVPMDGFHLDNETLEKRSMLARKGSPETFDAGGFVELVKLLKINDRLVEIPGFDRKSDRVVLNHDQVLADHQVVLVEGNYLLLKAEPWSELAGLFDITVFINPGLKVLEKRLIQRWLDHDHTPEEARTRALSNDIPNAERVLSDSISADFQVKGE